MIPSNETAGAPRERGVDMTIDKINVKEKLARFSETWSPKIVGEVNDSLVKLVKFQGEFVWHHHDREDEMFLVIAGHLSMELEGKTLELDPGEFVVIPRGVEHKPRADRECSVMLFEPKTTLNTGNVKNERTLAKLDRI
jgi:mannose-6-phosphate isomerase-like protein (cupin superfamily)